MTDSERRIDRLERITNNGTAIFVRKDVYTAEMAALERTIESQTEAIRALQTAHEHDSETREISKRQVTLTLLAAGAAIVTQFSFWLIDRLSQSPIPGVNS